MFQADALLPWKTVLGNVMMGPLFRGMPKREARDRAARLAAPGRPGRLRGPLPAPALRRHAQARRAGGGADQRAVDPADGRAVRRARRADQGDHAQRAARRCGSRPRPSVLFITHDLEEAVALADKVVVMTASPGTVKAVFDIDLPRPRGEVQEIRFERPLPGAPAPDLGSLRDEVERAYPAQHGARPRSVMSRASLTRAEVAPDETVRSRRSVHSPRPRPRRRAQRPAHGAGSGRPRIAAFVIVFGGWQLFTVAEDRRPVLLRPAQRDRRHSLVDWFTARHRVRLDLGEALGHDEGGRPRLPARHGRRRRASASLLGQNRFLSECSARTSRS